MLLGTADTSGHRYEHVSIVANGYWNANLITVLTHVYVSLRLTEKVAKVWLVIMTGKYP